MNPRACLLAYRRVFTVVAGSASEKELARDTLLGCMLLLSSSVYACNTPGTRHLVQGFVRCVPVHLAGPLGNCSPRQGSARQLQEVDGLFWRLASNVTNAQPGDYYYGNNTFTQVRRPAHLHVETGSIMQSESGCLCSGHNTTELYLPEIVCS